MIDRAVKEANKSEFKNRVSFRVGTVEEEVKNSSDKYDLVYSNATLHWCLNHSTLMPAILNNMVNPQGGVFAVQMPDTREQESHVLMETAALRCGFLETIKEIRIPRVNADPTWYFKILSKKCASIDMWSTQYIQQLPTAQMPAVEYDPLSTASRHPVLEYTKSTGLLPILQVLGGEGDERCKKYLREYERLLIDQYPTTKLTSCDKPGEHKLVTLMPFKRFFFVCQM